VDTHRPNVAHFVLVLPEEPAVTDSESDECLEADLHDVTGQNPHVSDLVKTIMNQTGDRAKVNAGATKPCDETCSAGPPTLSTVARLLWHFNLTALPEAGALEGRARPMIFTGLPWCRTDPEPG